MGESSHDVATLKRLKLVLIKNFYNGIYQVVYKLKRDSKTVVVFATQREKVMGTNLLTLKLELESLTDNIQVKEIAYRKANTPLGKVTYFFRGIVSTYWLGKADKFIIDDYFFPVYCINKQAGTTVVQLWHALGSFKKFGHALVLKEHKVIKPHVNYDYVFINNENDKKAYQEAFLVPEENIYAVGMSLANEIFRESIKTPSNEKEGKVILYAPTYRFDKSSSATEVINELVNKIIVPQGYRLVVSLHPYISKKELATKKGVRYIFNASKTAELLPVVSLLITDYSSIIYNFSRWQRPILFYAPDYQGYKGRNGFFIDWIEKSGQGTNSDAVQQLNDKLQNIDKLDNSFVKELCQNALPACENSSLEIIKIVFPEYMT